MTVRARPPRSVPVLPLLFGPLLVGLLLVILVLILACLLILLLPSLGATGVPCGLSLGLLILVGLALIWLCLILLATVLPILPAITTPLRPRNVGGGRGSDPDDTLNLRQRPAGAEGEKR